MRQMRDDELQYMLFASMRVQFTADRKGLALPAHRNGDKRRRSLAVRIVDYFRICEFYVAGEVRGRAALEVFFTAAIDALPLSVLQGFGSNMSSVQRRARYEAAQLLFVVLDGFEALSGSPAPPPMRFADYEGGSGVPAVGG